MEGGSPKLTPPTNKTDSRPSRKTVRKGIEKNTFAEGKFVIVSVLVLVPSFTLSFNLRSSLSYRYCPFRNAIPVARIKRAEINQRLIPRQVDGIA